MGACAQSCTLPLAADRPTPVAGPSTGSMFSNNKITGMTVVLSETLKEIITKNDTAQINHPMSVFNKTKPNIKYVATKPWEQVQRGEKPPDAGLYPGSGYCGHVPNLRETHGASYQSSLKLAQRATMSKTIRTGEHYTDGGHFVTTQEVGALGGGTNPSMPPSARRTSRQGSQLGSARDARLAQRRESRQNTATQMQKLEPEVRGDVLGGEAGGGATSRLTDRSVHSKVSTARSRRSGGSGRMSNRTDPAGEVKQLFEQLPPSRKEAIIQDLSTGWLQNK